MSFNNNYQIFYFSCFFLSNSLILLKFVNSVMTRRVILKPEGENVLELNYFLSQENNSHNDISHSRYSKMSEYFQENITQIFLILSYDLHEKIITCKKAE